MRWKSGSIICILLGLAFAAALSAGVLGADDEIEVEYLPNPFAADRPEWDPFGPDLESEYTPGRPDWDPYSPESYDVPQLISDDPFAPDLNLSIGDEVVSPNQLYLQSGSFLVTDGSVSLATPYSLWLYVADIGPLSLYDGGDRVLSLGLVSRGWYRLDRYAETLESHLYRFNTSTQSNPVIISVSSAGYPTGYGLVGRVVDPYGNGISGAGVRISGSGGGVFSTAANAQGYYGMDVPSGTYTVTAELEGFTFSTSTARVWTGAVSAAGTIVGRPAGWTDSASGSYPDGAGWLEGVVTERSGAPVSGAAVRIDGILTVTTDEDGGYQTALGPGWHSVMVAASGYKFSPASVQIIAGQGSRLDIQGTEVVALGKYS